MTEEDKKTVMAPQNRYSRRQIIASVGAATIVGGGLILRPEDNARPTPRYFDDLSNALKQSGITTPTLIIDRKRLQQNIGILKEDLPSDMAYRIVTKSLPSINLIDEIMRHAITNRIMVFNLPFLKLLAAQGKYHDVLLGKPMPIAAVKNFYQSEPQSSLDIQWLVDTPRRVEQYGDLAKSFSMKFKVNLEIDVGLHRGGFTDPQEIKRAIVNIQKHSNLKFSGFMGYEAQLAAVPSLLGIRDRAKMESWAIYKKAIEVAREALGADYNPDQLLRNTGGSLTYKLYKNNDIANEVSVGSALVKPTHFDSDMLQAYVPASFIATPVIKSLKGLNIPYMGGLNSVMELWNPNKQKTFFIYGGNWMADPVSPIGLSNNNLYGRSSNQEMLNGSDNVNLQPDDFVFFRPHQSEAVFLQFGDIAVYENKEIVDSWPIFPASA